jgi:hypothetical protein
MNAEPPKRITFSPSSSHIRDRDGAPAPKQPQSSVRPRSRADNNAVKNTKDINATASAPTRLVGGQSTRRLHAISKGGKLNASGLMSACGRIAKAATLSANCSGSRILSTPAYRKTAAGSPSATSAASLPLTPAHLAP